MLYIIGVNGNTEAVMVEPINLGSTGVNNISLLAPFPANTKIAVSAILPNGISLRNKYAMQAQVLPVELKAINGNGYNFFTCIIDESLTSVAGTVQVQFSIIQGIELVNGVQKPRILATYTTGFSVGVGVPLEVIPPPTDADYYNAILAYLAEINADPVQSVIYRSSDYFNVPSAVSTYPSSLEYNNSNFTAEGSYNLAGTNRIFFSPPMPSGVSEYGFTLDYGATVNVGVIQLWMYSKASDDIRISVATSTDGAMFSDSVVQTIRATTQGVAINPRFNLNDVNARYIRITFNTTVIVNAVQSFRPNLKGEYVITFKSGATAIIDACDGGLVQFYAQQVEQAYNSIMEIVTGLQKDVPGGVAGIGANGYVGAQFIPPIVRTDYFEVASEDALTSLSQAQNGDIAYVVNADNVVLNSWILLAPAGTVDGYATRANWKEQSVNEAQSAAYAAQAGYATSAGNVNGVVLDIVSRVPIAPNANTIYFLEV